MSDCMLVGRYVSFSHLVQPITPEHITPEALDSYSCAARFRGNIVKLLWIVCHCVHVSCVDLVNTIETKLLHVHIFIKLGKHINHDERMNPILGQR